jgi:hypothetical protein
MTAATTLIAVAIPMAHGCDCSEPSIPCEVRSSFRANPEIFSLSSSLESGYTFSSSIRASREFSVSGLTMTSAERQPAHRSETPAQKSRPTAVNLDRRTQQNSELMTDSGDLNLERRSTMERREKNAERADMALGENPRKMILHCTNQIKVSEAYSDENGDGFRKICLSYTPPPIDFLHWTSVKASPRAEHSSAIARAPQSASRFHKARKREA